VLFVIALVVLLSLPKNLKRNDLSHDGSSEMPLLLQLRDPAKGVLLLLFALEENDRAILAPNVRTLTV
jgi:hypothetical protein